jgi:hypothetical protein
VSKHRAANAKDLATHLARSTFRPDRHLGLTKPDPPATPLPPGARRRLLAGLGEDGGRFARQMLTQFVDWSPVELAVLRQICLATDRLAALEATVAADGMVLTGARGARREHPLAGKIRAETRTLSALRRQLPVR